uniref:Uncharacterized protein n=1 Tax=Anguilla anguilla TaxID=7936 RepID=A0A0E9QDV1_ANGAN
MEGVSFFFPYICIFYKLWCPTLGRTCQICTLNSHFIWNVQLSIFQLQPHSCMTSTDEF